MANTKIITSVTHEKWQEIDAIRKRTIADQTNRIDHNEARRVVADMWKRLGHKPPITLIAPSPLTASLWASSLATADVDFNGNKLGDQLWGQLGDQLRGQLGDQPRGQLWGQLWDQLWDQLGGQLWGQLGDQLGDQLRDQLGDQLRDQLRGQRLFWSYWLSAWSAFYEGGAFLGVQYDPVNYDLFRRWCKHVPMCLPREGLCVVSDNPIEIHWRNGLLHNEDGPAVKYADGFEIYSMDGTRLDEQIVMRPETQTLDQIRRENSNDIRAIRMERYGLARYLVESGAVVLDDVRNDIEGTHEALLDLDGDRYLWPTCPSGRICPPLGVPDDVTTCEQARVWLAGEKPFRVIART